MSVSGTQGWKALSSVTAGLTENGYPRPLWPSGSGHLGRQRSCPVSNRRRVQHGSIAFRPLPPKDVVNQCLEFGASQGSGCCVHPVPSADADEVWQRSLILHRRSSLCCCFVARMSVDILGTSRDQCVSMVQYCFTSTATIRLVRKESPGRPPRLSHSS